MFRNALMALGVVVAFSASKSMAAPDQITLPPSSVDRYRIDSHYGPDVGVLNPTFPHEDKVELGFGGVYSPVSSLVNSYGYTGSLVYHFSMRHAFEPIRFSNETTKLTSFVKDEITKKTSSNPDGIFVEAPKRSYIASYLFSPYYAKMHITERSVTHFDVYFGVGAGIVQSQSLSISDHLGATQSKFAGSLATGIRFLAPARWSLRLELRDLIYTQENFARKTTANAFQLGLNLGVFFGKF